MVAKLKAMKLAKAAKCVEDGVSETLTYMAYPREHWTADTHQQSAGADHA